MKSSIRTGASFGIASGVITTLGLIVGLYAGTESLAAVLGGILVIAISDSMSDAFGIHLAEEARSDTDTRDVWQATLTTFASKFLMALSFIVPLLLLPLEMAVYLDLFWGALVLTALSHVIARSQGQPVVPVIMEHLVIAVVVVVLSWLVGIGVNRVL